MRMSASEYLFWLLALSTAYVYVLYPLLMLVRVHLRGSRRNDAASAPASVSIVLAARDEEATIGRRLGELTELILGSGLAGEVILVSDGSTDRTADVARTFEPAGVRVIELPVNVGKASAISAGCAVAHHEIIAFADVRQTWAPDALTALLRPFADPSVGAVSGDLVIESSPGVMAGVGLYWRYEKWLRRLESECHSGVGVTGAISAVRRELFRPIPQGTILDDVYWPLRVAMQGYRVVHEESAVAYDRLPERQRDEFRRKVRTLSGNFQLAVRLPGALVPWRNPVWFEFISHKLMRLLVPWALIGILVLSAVLAGAAYRWTLISQAAFYALAALGLWTPAASRLPLISGAGSFVLLNAAAWVAFWVWVTGRAERAWVKVPYNAPVAGLARPRQTSVASGAIARS
jgi:biofilm PGA synthesis N-glycosyltransferase PgaC